MLRTIYLAGFDGPIERIGYVPSHQQLSHGKPNGYKYTMGYRWREWIEWVLMPPNAKGEDKERRSVEYAIGRLIDGKSQAFNLVGKPRPALGTQK